MWKGRNKSNVAMDLVSHISMEVFDNPPMGFSFLNHLYQNIYDDLQLRAYKSL